MALCYDTCTQIQFPISMLLPSVGSISTKAVTVDEVDMLVREENQLAQLMPENEKKKQKRSCDVRLREFLKLSTGNTISKILSY